MTNEASKTRAARGEDFLSTYFSGRVIDIGCGPDLVVPHAEPFDLEHGDAQLVGQLRPNEAYDCVHSSHCLEHMRDVPAALLQWWSLVRPGGYLIVVVPDEDLYEQGGWPSLFNLDHKATFRYRRKSALSPVSYDIAEIVQALPGCTVLECVLQDHGYDYDKKRTSVSALGRVMYLLQRSTSYLLRRLGLSSPDLQASIRELFYRLGAPLDQTQGSALAQIQIIARKRSKVAPADAEHAE